MGEIIVFVCSKCSYEKSYFLGTGFRNTKEKKLYECADGYNEIWTYRMESGCWEAYLDTQWNSRCD